MREIRIISNSLEIITKDATLWINMVEPAWAVFPLPQTRLISPHGFDKAVGGNKAPPVVISPPRRLMDKAWAARQRWRWGENPGLLSRRLPRIRFIGWALEETIMSMYYYLGLRAGGVTDFLASIFHSRIIFLFVGLLKTLIVLCDYECEL